MHILKLSLLSFGILFGSTVFAQDKMELSKKQLSNQPRQEIRGNDLSQELELSEKQKEQISEIRKRTNEDRLKLKNTHRMDKARLGDSMKELRAKEREEISKILTPEQLVKFDASKDKRQRKFQKQRNTYPIKKSPNKDLKDARKMEIIQNPEKAKKQLAPSKQ